MKKILAIFSLILFLSLPLYALTIEGPLMTVQADHYYVGQTMYLPLPSIVKAYGLSHTEDFFAQRIVLADRTNHIEIVRASKHILFNNQPIKLENPLVVRSGVVYVPYSFLGLLSKTPGSSSRPEYYPPSILVTPKIEEKIPPPNTYLIRQVVIDPGHGGKDPGAVYAGRYEKDIVLDIAKRLRPLLTEAGIKVTMTREGDKFISLWRRADIANKKKADLFISIHANAARARRAYGFEVYYLSEKMDDATRALVAAENASLRFEDETAVAIDDKNNPILWDLTYTENRTESVQLAKSLTSSMARQLRTKNRGEKGAKFYVLKHTQVPSVLIEVGFMTNRNERSNLSSSSYRHKIAETIAEGIINFKAEYERTDGFTR